MQGKLFIFSAPSGAGKSTIVQHLARKEPKLSFSISATSRPPRGREQDGRDYYFIREEEFRKKIEEDAFLEWEEVYPGRYYGTLRSEVERIWKSGRHALFDIDVRGGLHLKREFGPAACAVFVMPPSMDILEKRLRSRGTDGEKELQKRLGKAALEMKYAPLFDHVVVNDSLPEALQLSEELVQKHLAT